MLTRRSTVAAIAAALLVLQTPLAAEPLPQPEGDVILVLSGAISASNGEGEARFDRAMLEALPETSFETETIWTEGARRFTGVLLADLLAHVGAQGRVLRAQALNDYAVEIPVSDAVADGPIIAWAIDGDRMTVRDKGPLWVVYPYDSRSAYRTEVIYTRSIWQLARIDVRQ